MSNLIKASNYIAVDDHKLIEAVHFNQPLQKTEQDQEELAAEDQQEAAYKQELEKIEAFKEEILNNAREEAEQILRIASAEAEKAKDAAQKEIDAWWQERRSEDESVIEQARQTGLDRGYQEGLALAEEEMKQQWNKTIDEANQILAQAYSSKEQIIQEAEPFLIELSCAIAEKIIGKQLTLSQEWYVEMIKEVLLRRREKGVITLCVAPSQFTYVLNARDELVLAVDSQADLQILPDRTVKEFGCVIRTEFGSIDARIDTQLTEIKNSLYQLARGDFSETDITSNEPTT